MPKKPAHTVKAKNKKAKLSWKKVSGVSGYELYQSEKKGKGYKKIASCKSSITQYTKSGLKHKKNYYYKMRAYITNGKTKVYSDYSAVKKAKVK